MSDESTGEPAHVEDADLSGARFTRVQLKNARMRNVDLSGAVLRSVGLVGTVIDGEIDGLTINGVEVGPLIKAEQERRDPTRAAIAVARDPIRLQAAWEALTADWERSYHRVASMPEGTTELSVMGEWSFTQTLRHLVFATDAWLAAARRSPAHFHPAGLPFTDMEEFIDVTAADLGIDRSAALSYHQAVELRRDRGRAVREFLATLTPDALSEPVIGPPWEHEPLPVLTCLRVILNEEYEHRRFAERDLALIEAGSPLVGAEPRPTR